MPPTRHSSRQQLAGAFSGLLAGAAGIGAAEAVTALLDGVTSPLLAVANRAVDSAPRPVKEWAIETFGSADKAVLIGGVILAVVGLAVVAGVVAVRRLGLAIVMFLTLSGIAAVAAVTDRAATAPVAPRLLPVTVLVVVGLVSLSALARAVRRSPSAAHLDRSGRAEPEPRASDELPAGFDRRAFLARAAAVSAVAAAGGLVSRQYGGSAAAVARAGVVVPRPGDPAAALTDAMTFDVEGLTPYLTPNRDFYRVDTALRVPDVPIDTWRLRIHGAVDREVELSYEDLLSRRLVERRITLTCVSNPVGGDLVGNATWIGVPVRELLAEAGVRPNADAVKSTSSDGMTIGTPLQALTDDRDALVAVAMNGQPLPLEHGFPARLVVPGLYGYVSATKWLVDLEVTRFADFEAYWSSRGYAAEAPIKTSSRIDVPRSFARVDAGPTTVAGVAWAQGTGVERVEVRVDAGPWQRATLAAEDTITTWRQWRWEWEAAAGNHTLEVRATDRNGDVQTSRRAPIAPDGSTGWHSVAVTVV